MAGKSLTVETLPHPREATYFVIVLVGSILLWIALSCVLIFWLPFAALFGWLANGLFIARLRSEAVEVTEFQMPALHRVFVETCERLGQTTVPRLYVLESGGLLNAFATRFCARDFVAVYSDMLEACGPDSCEMRFILGHEIGHIRQSHLLKQIVLLPGLFLPLIGNAYRRSRESTCDRFGMFAANDSRGAIHAMMMLVGGREAGRKFDAEMFAAQYQRERGFFVSWHELLSSYPTLSRRVADLLALERGEPEVEVRRHPLAYLLGLITLSTPGGGITSVVITFILIFYFALIAIPMAAGFAASRLPDISETLDEPGGESEISEAEILAKGVIDERLIGLWRGTNEGNDWTTERRPDGTVETKIFDEDGEAEVLNGQWRLVGDLYYELFEGGTVDRYRVESFGADRMVFRDPDEAGGTLLIELRQ